MNFRQRATQSRRLCRALVERRLPSRLTTWSFSLYYAFWRLRRSAERDEPDLSVVRQIVRPGDCVIDGGANIGRYTVPLAEIVGVGGDVIAVEPVRRNADILRAVLRWRRLDCVKVVEAAISDHVGTASMVVPVSPDRTPNYYRAAISHTDANRESMTVPTVTLNSILSAAAKPPTFIKLDLEGHERAALDGAALTMGNGPAILFEESSDPEDPHSDSHQIESMLVAMGYRLKWYDRSTNSMLDRAPDDHPTNMWALTNHHLAEISSRGDVQVVSVGH